MKLIIVIVCIAYAHALVWRDCGDNADRAVNFNKISVRNEPIQLPGSNAFAGEVDFTKAIDGPLSFKIQIWKKVWVWVKVPCISNVGSCSYDNGCALIKTLREKADASFLAEPSCNKPLQSLGLCDHFEAMKAEIRAGGCATKLMEAIGMTAGQCVKQCPIPAMTLKRDTAIEVDLPALPSYVPSIIASGTYAVQVEAIRSGKQEACLYVETSLKKN